MTPACQLLVRYVRQAKYAEAAKMFDASLKTREVRLGSEHPVVADTQVNAAIVYRRQRQCQPALELLTKALATYQKTYGKKHPSVASALYECGCVHSVDGALLKALTHIERAVNAGLCNFDISCNQGVSGNGLNSDLEVVG